MQSVTRFAPSPSGLLHRGHAFSALTAQRFSQETGGRFLLRMEDIDSERCKTAFEVAILADLAWLGIAWDRLVRRQSNHQLDYKAALESLRARGLLYRCFRTRKEIAEDIGRAPHGLPAPFTSAPLAPRDESERISRGDPYSWRLSLSAAKAALGGFDRLAFIEDGAGPAGEHGLIAVDPARGGDVILARKDGMIAYHLAVVIDDAAQGVTHVIRGEDLHEAAHVQRLLQALLDLPAPVYRHHRLLLGPDGKRYAKRDKAQTLAELRAAGVSPAQLRAELGFS